MVLRGRSIILAVAIVGAWACGGGADGNLFGGSAPRSDDAAAPAPSEGGDAAVVDVGADAAYLDGSASNDATRPNDDAGSPPSDASSKPDVMPGPGGACDTSDPTKAAAYEYEFATATNVTFCVAGTCAMASLCCLVLVNACLPVIN